ncbi:hypothetical protein KY317_02560, partial [Candidatus Woesearchaeota archaeon]|nr:hypothetical protein [Candidatus Woesearchaeota archaeon]
KGLLRHEPDSELLYGTRSERLFNAIENRTGFDLLSLNDAGLELLFYFTKSRLAKKLYYDRLRFRDTLKTSVVFKIEGYEKEERIAGKPIAVFGLSEEEMKRFDETYKDVRNISNLEDTIAKEMGVEQGDLLIAAMPFAGRLMPKDVCLYSLNEGWYSLFEKYPNHRTMLFNSHKDAFAIRVVTTEEKRSYICGKADEIKDIILEQIK